MVKCYLSFISDADLSIALPGLTLVIYLAFSLAVKHPYPFSDQVVLYIRHLGPGVLVGQAWQEGKALEQVPQKLCGEILMVKDNVALS